MERTKIEIEIIRNDKGIIFLRTADGCTVPIRNIIENNGLLSTLEVELDFAIKKQKQS